MDCALFDSSQKISFSIVSYSLFSVTYERMFRWRMCNNAINKIHGYIVDDSTTVTLATVSLDYCQFPGYDNNVWNIHINGTVEKAIWSRQQFMTPNYVMKNFSIAKNS